MGHMVDFATLPCRETGKGIARGAITRADARYMAAELVRLSPGASYEDEVPSGSDLYLFALSGTARIGTRGQTRELEQDAFATLQEGTAYSLSNPGHANIELISVLAPPKGSAAAKAGFSGGIAVTPRAQAPSADVTEQKKRRLYFVDQAAAQSERAHAMIVEYQADTLTAMHHHPNADSMFIPLTGKVRFTFDGKDHVVARGQATVFPAGDNHGLQVEAGQVSFLEFHVPAGYVTVK